MGWKIVVTVIIILALLSTIVLGIYQENKKARNYCEDNGIYDLCSKQSRTCFQDCKFLGKEYFKTKFGNWGERTCICRVGNQTEIIW